MKQHPPISLRSSLYKTAKTAIQSRFLILFGMALSCAVLPDFYPGDDVPSFDLRLSCTKFCQSDHVCHDPTLPNFESGHRVSAHVYKFILSPLTRWDAARFLHLAVHTTARHPSCLLEKVCTMESFEASEQAHAFFPLVPFLIRNFAIGFLYIIPTRFLPPTFEALAALAAVLLNFIAFVLAALFLHYLTYTVLQRYNKTHGKQIDDDTIIYLAQSTAYLYCVNPAGVFFSSAYSESTFSCFTFCGYALAANGHFWFGCLCFMVAACARSNGTVASCWILLVGCARIISVFSVRDSIKRSATGILSLVLYHLALAIMISLPFVYHNHAGYDIHCISGELAVDGILPNWCDYDGSFSLYSYVQRKHWNVGLFRYYEAKQIPNFLLALPVLWIGFLAAREWIRYSWNRYIDRVSVKTKFGNRSFHVVDVLKWAIFALRESDFISEVQNPQSDTMASKNENTHALNPNELLLNPFLLPHYAVLSAICLLGALLAHVQITTRMVCSSCPAFYWFCLVLLLRSNHDPPVSILCCRHLLCCYFIGFNVLGIIMHVNWLPWT